MATTMVADHIIYTGWANKASRKLMTIILSNLNHFDGQNSDL